MTCEHCGAALPAFALFCGECGRSVAARPMAAPGSAVVVPPALPLVDAVAPSPPEVRVVPCSACGLVPEPDDLYCAECGAVLAAQTRIIEPVLPPPIDGAPDSLPSPPQPAPLPVQPAPEGSIDVESTRLVPRGTGGARFVLQFSTGESYTVLGSGLAGRNPRPEPDEYVDHLVTIVDPGRSVSKTHLEFGQEGGVFWVADRHSGNGTVIREPGAEPRSCRPGNRYPVVRGTRIDIGEQFVIVS